MAGTIIPEKWVADSTVKDPNQPIPWETYPWWPAHGGYYKYQWWGVSTGPNEYSFLAWAGMGNSFSSRREPTSSSCARVGRPASNRSSACRSFNTSRTVSVQSEPNARRDRYFLTPVRSCCRCKTDPPRTWGTPKRRASCWWWRKRWRSGNQP